MNLDLEIEVALQIDGFLDLRSRQLGPDDVRIISISTSTSSVRLLNLRSNNIGDKGVEELASSVYLGSLEGLDISGNHVGNAGAQALAKSPIMARIKRLHACDNRIGPTGLSALFLSPNASSLDTLHICNNKLGRTGAFALATSPNLSSLEAVFLGGCGVRAEEASAIAASPFLRRLESVELQIGQAVLTNDGLFCRKRESQRDPLAAWGKEDPCLRVLAFSFMPPEEQARRRTDFLALAYEIGLAVASQRTFQSRVLWAWCQFHIWTWADNELHLARAFFPSWHALEARCLRQKETTAILEGHLFS